MRSLPASLLQALLRAGTDVMRRRHPYVFERLGVLDGTLILIDPIDLPICLAIEFVAGDHRLRVACAEDRARASTIVRGPLLVLIDLVEGRLDGDAQFFSRALTIEGDTEAVVMLRNTLDNEDIDMIQDLTSVFGPLSRPAARLAEGAKSAFDRVERDLAALREALLAPVVRRTASQQAALGRLDERVVALEKRARHDRSRRPATTRADNAFD
jgi:predicted lipid carrier protein YhbT